MKNINFIIGRFQPLTNGHLKCVDYIWNKYHIPTVIGLIETSKLDEKHPFPTDFLYKTYKRIFKNSNKVIDIILVKNADIVKNAQILRDNGYNIKYWTCGSDRFENYNKMAIKYKKDAGLDDDFKCIEIKRLDEDISATKVREILKNDDFEQFSKLTPYSTLESRMHNNDIYLKLKYYINNIKY